MAARREVHYLGLHQRVSCLCARDRLQIRRLLLCCGVLLAVSEHEADDKLEAVASLREKSRPQPTPGPTTPRRSAVFLRRYTAGLRYGAESSSATYAGPK